MIVEIWHSFRRMPLWVQFWVLVILAPANLLPLAFVSESYGVWVAALSVGGMLPNLPIMLMERGLSKRMALPHLLIWTPLIVLIGWLLLSGPVLSDGFRSMLIVLLIVDLVSLAFDYVDAWKWKQGDRAIA
jgi:hypothetical protein